MAPGYIFQVFLRVTIENQVCIHQWIIFRGKQWIRSVFRRTQKIRTFSLSEKSSGFVVLVHLQGLEPWAHWLRETNGQQSSIFRITQIRYFHRFIANFRFASAAFFAPAIPSCIRYPAVPVCKNVQSQNQPLKTGIGFLCKGGKTVGFEPKTAAAILPV